MAHTRDLYKTKLCTLYQRGNCPRQSCSFAHGDGELRRFPSALGMSTPFSGRGDGYRSGDLRERLERRRTPPPRRRSPVREIRPRPAYYGRNLSPRDRGARSRTRTPPLRRRPSRSLSAQRSTPQKREVHPVSINRRENKRARHDTAAAHFSDVSGEGHGTEDTAADGDFRTQIERAHSSNHTDTMENQLRQIQSEYEELLDEKAKLQHSLDKTSRESMELLAQNQELESRLHGAKNDYKRLGLKMKSFLKYYARYIRAKDVASKTQTKLQQLAEELLLEDGKDLNAHAAGSDIDVGSDAELQHPTHHHSGLTNHTRVHDRVTAAVNHIPGGPTPVVCEESEVGALVARRTVPSFVQQANRESEEASDAHEAGMELSGSKLAAIVAQNNQRASNRLVVHQNGYRNREADEGDWSVRPSVQLSLAATNKGEKDEVKEEFFVPLESKAGHRLGADMPVSSRSPPADKVKVREVLSLPPNTTMSSHAREFDLERRETPQRGSNELNGLDGEGVNVSLSLSSRAYRPNGSEPLGSLLPQSLSITSDHYEQGRLFKRHGEDLDMSVGGSGGDLNELGVLSGGEVLVESSSLQN